MCDLSGFLEISSFLCGWVGVGGGGGGWGLVRVLARVPQNKICAF